MMVEMTGLSEKATNEKYQTQIKKAGEGMGSMGRDGGALIPNSELFKIKDQV
jgi:hypothetical protein